MKVLAILLAICASSFAQILYDDLYPIQVENGMVLRAGDGDSSTTFKLQLPIIFYDDVFTAISVNFDGSVQLQIQSGEENPREAIVAPFILVDPANRGKVYYHETSDSDALERATGDVHRGFAEAASDFEAESVFVVTWDKIGSQYQAETNYTFQCVLITDGLSSFVIFLYPSDAFAVSEDSETIREQLFGKAGFNAGGRNELETMSAVQLLDGGSPRPGEWIFQIGGIMLSLEYSEPAHHVKEETEFSRRQSGFEVSEVDFNEDYISDVLTCDGQTCASENAHCAPFSSEECCQCNEGYTGNGVVCIEEDQPVIFNGVVSGHSILMNEDNSWSNETAKDVDLHSYVHDGRAHVALNGNISDELSRAIQPMLIFPSTLGWMFAKTDGSALNGFQMTGGKITSDTYIRYTTGQYEFRIRQIFEGLSSEESIETGRNVFIGNMIFSGRLPSVPEDAKVTVEDFSQVYTRYGEASVRSEDTRTYTVGDTTHTYTIDQTIDFSSCRSYLENEPQKSTVEVDGVYIEFFKEKGNLRYAFSNYIQAASTESDEVDDIGVRPTPEATEEPAPETEEPEVEEEADTFKTRCEIQLEDAERLQPHVQDEVFFPTCTDIGTYAPRQCKAYDSVCWCVDADSGEEIAGTRTEPLQGYSLDCSDIRPPPESLTPCEEERRNAQIASSKGGPGVNSIYMPVCMDSGAYEPLQQLPDGSFMCVDFAGKEVSRSTEQPRCLTSCQMESYIAEASNIFKKTNYFVVECLSDGRYKPKQCTTNYCYCVDTSGLQDRDSRVEIGAPLDCDESGSVVLPHIETPKPTEAPAPTEAPEPTEPPRKEPVVPDIRPERPDHSPPRGVSKLLFAQSMGINIIDLPVALGATSRRLFARSDQTAVAVSYDCSSKVYYWTDVAKRVIYSSSIDGNGVRNVFANDKVRSPEGISVDFLSGNVYWTDSEYDRIEVARTDGTSRMTLVSGGMINPRGIAVDPFRGRMYWTDWHRKSPKIWVADMDGRNKRVLVSDNLGLPNDITIDFAYQRVCFIDAGTKRVECMNFDGSRRETVYTLPTSPVQHPFGLAIDGDTLYYSTWRGSKVVHAVNWRTGSDVPISGPRGSHGQMFGVELIPPQCPLGYNYCMNNNGGCSHLCLPTPTGRECKCPPTATDCQ